MMLVFAGAALGFVAALMVLPIGRQAPSWSSSDGSATPPDFLYAMFPVNHSVPLYDSPGGTRVAILSRAVVNSQAEIVSGGWVQVHDSGGLRFVELATLDYLPGQNADPDSFKAFASSYQARDAAEHRGATLEIQPTASGIATARLRIEQENHWQEYVYDVVPGKATPRRMCTVFGPGAALQGVERLGLALVAACAAAALCSAGLARWGARRRAAAAQNGRLDA